MKSPLPKLVHWLHGHLIWVIVASYLAAAWHPAPGLWIRDAELVVGRFQDWRLALSVPPLLLAMLLFNAGLGANSAELRQILRQPMVLAAGLIGNVATPLGFIIGLSVLMRLWHNPEEVQQILVGFALVASMPIAGASTAWSQNANGNLALSLGLVLLTTLLSPLLTPMVLHAVGFVTTGDYSEDLHELATDGVVGFLGAWVILPSLFGMLAHRLLGPGRVERMKPHLKLVNLFVLVLLNYANAALALPKAMAQPDLDFLAITGLIAIALCLVAFGAGHLVARACRADRRNRVALVFGLGMNNNGTGLVLAAMSLSDHPEVMLPIIFYNLIQHLMAVLVDRSLSRARA